MIGVGRGNKMIVVLLLGVLGVLLVTHDCAWRPKADMV
jgi:hypothetical protein